MMSMNATTTTEAEIDAWEATTEAIHPNDCTCDACEADYAAYIDACQNQCECEIDWDCGRHGGPRPTFLETRYQGLDAEEARAHGAYWDF